MALKYYQLSPPPSTASQALLNDFQALIDVQFTNSTDIFTIQRETTFGNKTYADINVRITNVVSSLTGQKLADDFKQILFQNNTYPITLGSMYYFSNNYWVCIYTDTVKSIVTNGVVARCNTQLRWVDDNGNLYTEYAFVDYDLIGTRDLVRKDELVLPQGYIPLYTQLNTRTELIKPNQRFLFGRPNQRVCWRVFGNAIQNSQATQTTDDTSSKLLTLTLGGYQLDENLDNLTLGIADYYRNVYTVYMSASSISGNVGEAYQLDAKVESNGNPTSASLTYASSTAKATVSSTGLVTLVSAGSSIITAYMGGNSTVSASALATITTSGTLSNEIRITPSDNTYVLEDTTQTFTAYLYTNGVQQADTMVFSVSGSNVPSANYTLTTIGSNTFTLKNNNKYLEEALLINATSGSYNKQINCLLKGVW